MSEKKKVCFVVGPIGDDGSDERIHADWLLDGIILPVFDEHFPEFRVDRSDKMEQPGRIDAQVIAALLNADLVVADLTFHNPNAFYEIGIRHVIEKPIIHMFLKGQRIPFDVKPFRSIAFDRTRPSDLVEARQALKAHVAATQEPGFVVDNPVTAARGRAALLESATPKDRLMQYQLEDLARRVQVIEEAQPSSLMTNVFGLRTDGRSAAVSNDMLHQFKNGTAIRVQAPDDGHVNAFTAALSSALGGSAISVTPGDSHGRYELEITGGGGRILDGEARRLGEACGVKILGFSMPVTGAK